MDSCGDTSGRIASDWLIDDEELEQELLDDELNLTSCSVPSRRMRPAN